jgi:hypothetical protein
MIALVLGIALAAPPSYVPTYGGAAGGGGSVTITSDTVTNCLALSPGEGDQCFATDEPWMMTYDGSAWVYQWRGFVVTPPADADWADLNLDVSSSRSESGLMHVATIVDTGTTYTHQGASATFTEGETHTVCSLFTDAQNGVSTSSDAAFIGFYESGTGKNIILRTYSASGGRRDVARRSSLDTASADSTAFTEESPDHWLRDSFVCAKLVWASDVLSIAMGPSPAGPWHTLMSGEGEGSYFTTAPDSLIWGAVNRSGKDQVHLLVHHEVE